MNKDWRGGWKSDRSNSVSCNEGTFIGIAPTPKMQLGCWNWDHKLHNVMRVWHVSLVTAALGGLWYTSLKLPTESIIESARIAEFAASSSTQKRRSATSTPASTFVSHISGVQLWCKTTRRWHDKIVVRHNRGSDIRDPKTVVYNVANRKQSRNSLWQLFRNKNRRERVSKHYDKWNTKTTWLE